MGEHGEKNLWENCMAVFKMDKGESHARLMQKPIFNLTQYDFVERLNENAALLCFSDGMVFDVRTQEIHSAQSEDYISSTISLSWKKNGGGD